MSRRPPMPAQTLVGFVMVGLAVVAVVVPWLGWATAARLDETVPPPGSPGAALRQLSDTGWPSAATVWTGLYAAAFALLLVGVLYLRRSRSSSSRRVLAERVRQMPTDASGLRRYRNATGPLLGRVMAAGRGGTAVAATTEDQIIVVGGPRLGKSTRLAVRWIRRDRDGLVLATSNKRDLYDATVAHRAAIGTVWLVDPEHKATSGPAPFWWNPLESCATVSGARGLARIWAQAARDADAKTDAFFDRQGEELLAGLLLAAAWHPQRRVSLVYEWLTNPDNPEPETVLREVDGMDMMAAGLASRREQHEKTRAGIYATAESAISWLGDRELAQWVEDPDGTRPQLSAGLLARSRSDTIVLLSQEGRASTAIVTALTAAVLEAAEAYAAAAGGRLPTPMLAVLDEAANVCRWRELPSLYSHYGSRGIILASFFQSGAQMIDGFGQEGAEKLWSSANVRMYLGGAGEDRFLDRLSKLVGEHDDTQWSESASYGGSTGPLDRRRSRSQSSSVRKVATFDVATLAAFPAGYALVLLSGTRPVVVELPAPFYEVADERRAS